MLRLGVIGYGYWGPNIVRNFASNPDATVVAICDCNTEYLQSATKQWPAAKGYSDFRELVKDPQVDAVAIVTPVSTHYEIAKFALCEGKSIFVEKPFTATVAQAEELNDIARKNNLTIMVDHTFLFTGAVRKIKEMVDNNTLGRLLYYDSQRVNLGLFQHDINVIWDLAPHDLSIADHIIREKPKAIAAHGMDHFSLGYECTAYLTVYYDSLIAHFSFNWLSPVKVRTTLIGGEDKMLLWDDIEPDTKVKLFDKGVNIKSQEKAKELLIDYRSGDMWAPKLDRTEALSVEASYFVDCVTHGKTPTNDGEAGLRVVTLLEACDKSLRNEGMLIRLD